MVFINLFLNFVNFLLKLIKRNKNSNYKPGFFLLKVKKLNKRFGEKLTWLVPLGTKQWMIDSGCSNVVELNWGDEHVLTTKSSEENETSDNPGVKFVFAPAQHWCTRTLLDENTRLWGSWIIIGPKHRVYFAGDTGYCDIFKTIGNLYGPFDLAAIPIGAYRPRYFFLDVLILHSGAVIFVAVMQKSLRIHLPKHRLH